MRVRRTYKFRAKNFYLNRSDEQLFHSTVIIQVVFSLTL
jgi:hypothetical protein